MKYRKIILIGIILIFIQSLPVRSAIVDDNPDKKIAIGINPFIVALLGPAFRVENTGLGPTGIYIGYTNYSAALMNYFFNYEYSLDLSGHSIAMGAKYYIEYDTEYYDTYYIACEYSYSRAEATHSDDKAITAEVKNYKFMFFGGRRFQWQTFFIDLSAGFGYIYQVADASEEFKKEYNVEELKDELGEVGGISYELRALCGVAF